MPELRILRRLPRIEFDAADDHGILALYESDRERGMFILEDNSDPSNTMFFDPDSLSALMDATQILRHAHDERELEEDDI